MSIIRILHINSYYSGSMFYKNLFDQQRKSGLDISVFVPVMSHINNSEKFGPYTLISQNHTKYDRVFFYVKHNKIYRDLVSKYSIEKYTIVHAHSLFSNGYIAMKLKENFNIPYVVAVRNTDVNLFFKKMVHLRHVGVQILKNADQVVFLSKPYQDEIIQNYVPENERENIAGKSIIVQNGIDDFWYRNIGKPKKRLNDPVINILQVGDINKNKNIKTTVKAINILKNEGYEIKLDIVGKVEDRQLFNSIIGLDFVNYLGYKSKEELVMIFRENDIFVLPSINETFGLVYAEAMTQGLPVIYSRDQGFDRQFDDSEVGYSVESKSEQELAIKVKNIIQNYDYLSKNCINYVSKFTWGSLELKYRNIYNSLIKKRYVSK